MSDCIYLCSLYCNVKDYIVYIEEMYEEVVDLLDEGGRDVIVCGRTLSEIHMLDNMIKKYPYLLIYKVYFYEVAIVACKRMSMYKPLYDMASFLYEKSYLSIELFMRIKILYKEYVAYMTKMMQTRMDNVDGKVFENAFRVARDFANYGEYYFKYSYPIGFPKERQRDNVFVNIVIGEDTRVTLWNKKPCVKGKTLLMECAVASMSKANCFECEKRIGSYCSVCYMLVCESCMNKHAATCTAVFRDVVKLSKMSFGHLGTKVFFIMYKLIVYALRRMTKGMKLLDYDLFLGITVPDNPCIYDRVSMEYYYIIMVYIISIQYKYQITYKEYLDLFHRILTGTLSCEEGFYFGRYTRLLGRSKKPNVKMIFENDTIRLYALKDIPANTPLYISH